MFSILAILSSRGDILIKEEYNSDITPEELNKLICVITKQKVFRPTVKEGDIYGHYILKDKIIILLASHSENSNFVTFQFIESLYTLIKNFCGSVTTDTIEQNVVLIHELLLECLQNGYIQSTNTEQLRAVVYSDPAPIKSDAKKPGLFGLERTVVPGSASSSPLVKSRSQQTFKSEEVFVDVVEKITVHFSQDGLIDLFYLTGAMKIKSFISLNHSLCVSLNDDLSFVKNNEKAYTTSVYLDSYDVDKCVDSTDFELKREFVIHPPRSEVSALRYRIESIPSQLPFTLESSTEESETSQDLNLTLKLKCNIPGNAKALNVIAHIPVSSSTRNVMQQFSIAECSADFISAENKILWKIKSLPGYSEVIAKFKLIDAINCPANMLEIGPVALEFEVSNFVCSGIAVKNIKAINPASKPIPMQKWVRYITSDSSYMFSICS